MESNQATVELQSAKMKGRELASRADRLNARPRHESHDTASPRLLELPTEISALEREHAAGNGRVTAGIRLSWN